MYMYNFYFYLRFVLNNTFKNGQVIVFNFYIDKCNKLSIFNNLIKYVL